MTNHADYSIIRVDPDRVFIVDLDLGNMSVTNDAEWVLGRIQEQYPNKRLIYRDSEYCWSELKGNKHNVCFAMYREYLPEVAKPCV